MEKRNIIGNVKEIHQIEANIFDIVESLHNNMLIKNKDKYKLSLVALDSLNEEYNELTGNYYVHPLRCLEYYGNLWSKF